MDPRTALHLSARRPSMLYGHFPTLLPAGTNFYMWRQAWHKIAVIHDAQHTLDTTYVLPQHTIAEHAQYIKNWASVRMLTTNFLPQDLAETTDLALEPPVEVLLAVQADFTDSSPRPPLTQARTRQSPFHIRHKCS